jgi:WD40 repeat protein
LLEKVAEGGMGVVCRARQLSLNRVVAVKMIQPGRVGSPEMVLRFRAEAEAAASLHHPNIVTIFETGECEGQHYFSMDYIEGQNLAEAVREGPLPSGRAAELVGKIAAAVHYAHQHKILHRDLKPSNVLLDETGEPHVTDFGLARRLGGDSTLTLTGQVFGSPQFMPPEQASGRRGAVGVQSDVYGLGAVLYHVLTARPPFVGETMETTLAQVLEQEPVSPRLLNASVPRDLETICLKCLEKEPSRRYATAQALADELGRFLHGEPILARPVSRPEKMWRWCRRKPALATALGAVVLVAALGFAGILTQWRRAMASELFARQNAYAADMNLAQRALEANDVRLAVSLLDKYRPGLGVPASAGAAHKTASEQPDRLKAGLQTDLRGWEWRYLWQLCQPDESVRLQTNSGYIGQMAISQDGKLMAMETGDNKIVLWDLTTKRQMAELPGSASIRTLALSPAGNWLAVSTRNAKEDPTVEVWDVPARKIQTTLAQRAPVRSLAFSPHETLLATFDNKGTVAVVELASNGTLTNFIARPPRRGEAGHMVFSPDGNRVVIGGDYGELLILNWQTGTVLPIQTQTSDGITALAFSPTDELIAAGFGYTSETIRLWDARSGEARGQLIDHAKVVRALAFSPDGRLLAAPCDGQTIRVWSVADQAELRCLRAYHGGVEDLAFLPDGRTLVSRGNDGVRFWDITASSRVPGYTNFAISYGFPDQARVAAQGFARGALDPEVVCRYGLTFTPDGQSFLAPDKDGFIDVWNIQPVQRTERLPLLGSNNWDVALSPDGRWLAAGDTAGQVNIWDWKARRSVTNFALSFEWFGRLRFSRSGRFLLANVVAHDHRVSQKIWRIASWEEVPLPAFQPQALLSADLSPDDQLLACGDAAGAVTLSRFPTGQREATFTNHSSSVVTVLFSPDGRTLSTSGFDEVKFWDMSARRELGPFPEVSGGWGMAFSSDGRRLLTGNAGGTDPVKLWDMATHRELLALQAQGQFFMGLSFSPDGNTLIAVSLDGVVSLWRAPSWAEIEAAEKGAVTP